MISCFNRLSRSTRILGSLALALAALVVTQGAGCPGGPNPPGASEQLWVVSNNLRVTSYTGAFSIDGTVTPTTNLPAGAATDIFQPRAVVVTKDNRLLVSRQNGGLTVHDNAKTVTGDKLADRTVTGNATLLTDPISFAYDKTNDRLYVGNATANDGILVFDNIGNAAFTGNKAPDRKFNPPDRLPTTNSGMGVNALALDSSGRLYVVDASGGFLNSSGILVFNNPATATGSTSPDRTITGAGTWLKILNIAIDSSDRLYVVDGNDKVYVFDNAANLNGAVVGANRTLTFTGAGGVSLDGILIGMNGTGILSDRNNNVVHTVTGIGTRATGTITPSTTFDATVLIAPRQMFLVEP